MKKIIPILCILSLLFPSLVFSVDPEVLLLLIPSINISVDNSSNSLNGNPQGSGIHYVESNFQLGGASLGFDGGVNDYINFDDEKFNSMQDFTVTAWNNNTNTVGSSFQFLGTRQSSSTNGEWWMGFASANRFQCAYVNGVSVSTLITVDAQEGTWYMASCSYNFTSPSGLNITMYINETKVGEVSSSTAIFKNAGLDVMVGYDSFTTLKGGLNGVYIVNESLSSEQITELWNEGSNGISLTDFSLFDVLEDNNVSTSTQVFLNATEQDIALLDTETFTASYTEINGTATFTRNGTPISNNSVQSLSEGVYVFNASIAATDSNFASHTARIATVILTVAPPVAEEEETTSFFIGLANVAAGALIVSVIVILVAMGLIKEFRGRK